VARGSGPGVTAGLPERWINGMGNDDMGGMMISGGRVVDPASGMDAAGDVALLDGKIAAVGTGLGGAERIIDAAGLVVAPASSTFTHTASRSPQTACRLLTG
jgi:adenine deaminase